MPELTFPIYLLGLAFSLVGGSVLIKVWHTHTDEPAADAITSAQISMGLLIFCSLMWMVAIPMVAFFGLCVGTWHLINWAVFYKPTPKPEPERVQEPKVSAYRD